MEGAASILHMGLEDCGGATSFPRSLPESMPQTWVHQQPGRKFILSSEHRSQSRVYLKIPMPGLRI